MTLAAAVLPLSSACLQGAGGVVTDWSGAALRWDDVSAGVKAAAGEVLAAGDPETHKQALELLQWKA